MLDVRLYLAQRLSALIMAPLVLGHLTMMIYAIRGGLTAAEILSRTQGSIWWGLFYGLFVAAVSVHAAIGVRVVVHEHLKLSRKSLNAVTWLVGIGLFAMGGRAVAAVVL
jgi:fumarate reductase subunit C